MDVSGIRQEGAPGGALKGRPNGLPEVGLKPSEGSALRASRMDVDVIRI